VFFYDRQLDTIKRISVSSNGAQSNHSSFSPDISADGRYVVFASFASNLSSVADSSDGSDVFLHDTVTGSTRQVSVDSMGRDVDGSQDGPVISANGKMPQLLLIFQGLEHRLAVTVDMLLITQLHPVGQSGSYASQTLSQTLSQILQASSAYRQTAIRATCR